MPKSCDGHQQSEIGDADFKVSATREAIDVGALAFDEIAEALARKGRHLGARGVDARQEGANPQRGSAADRAECVDLFRGHGARRIAGWV